MSSAIADITMPSGLEAFLAIDQAVLEAMPAAIYVCSADGVVVRFNRRATEMWGRTPRPGDTEERFCGAFRLYHLDGRPLPHAETPMETVLRTGIAERDKEVVIERPDGSRVMVLVNIEPLKGPQGRVQGAVNVFVDLTRRRQVDSELHKLASIIESSEDAIVSKDTNGIVNSWNRGAERLFGYSAEEIVGKSILTIIPTDRCDEETSILERIRRGEPIEHYETVRQRKDGSLVNISLSVSPMRNADGKVIGASKIARDITERVRAQEARRAVEESLRESERRLELALTAGRMGTWEWDIVGGNVIWSPMLEQIHGFEPGTFGGRFEDFRRDIHPEDRGAVLAAVRRTAETGDDYHVMYRTLRPDGTARWLEAFGVALIGANGKPRKLAGICMDITERKLAEEALRAHGAELESIIDRTPFMLTRCTRDLRYAFVSTAYADMLGRQSEHIIGKSIVEIVGEDGLNTIRPHIDAVLQGRRVEFESEVSYEGVGTLFLHVVYVPEHDHTGRVTGWIASILNITERKRAEVQRDLLVAELSHRVKNTLATVISIARQSFSKGPSIDEARRSFDGRILALAQTHGRLAEEHWSGVSFEVMLLDEFAPYRNEEGRNIKLTGPSITLQPRCALVLGMAFHELTTNAAKYGALSVKNGAVNVSWDVLPDRQLLIHWQEAGGPTVTPPERSGFGRLLLERTMTSDLRGEVTLDFKADGLCCDIKVPLDGHVAYINRAIQVAVDGRA